MGTVDEAALELLDTVLELVDDPVDGGEGVGGGRPGPHDETVAVHGDLADLPLGDAGVALLGELDLGPLHALEVPGQAGDLVLDRGAKGLGHLDVATANGDLHSTLLSLPRGAAPPQGCPYAAPCPETGRRLGCRSAFSAPDSAPDSALDSAPDSLPQIGAWPMPQCRQFGPRKPGWS